MPLERPVLPMSVEEFHAMEHRLGWKHEYWDGAAQLSCQPTAVASLRLELPTETPRLTKLGVGYNLRTVTVADAPELVELFVTAFDTAVEYAGWPQEDYVRDAHRSIDSFFDFPTDKKLRRAKGLLDHSFVARDGGLLVAAILVRQIEPGPIVEPVMVEPAHQRRGLGSALLAATIDSLQNAGTNVLVSRCHLGNAASMAWHLRNGFRELSNYFTAGHRAMHFHWLTEHYETRQQPEQAAEMRRLAEHWDDLADTLEPCSDPWR
jgi:RimJ/RimL family protein N-acetyltransferase